MLTFRVIAKHRATVLMEQKKTQIDEGIAPPEAVNHDCLDCGRDWERYTGAHHSVFVDEHR